MNEERGGTGGGAADAGGGQRVVLLFWDGVGLGGDGAANPWASGPALTPALVELLGGPLAAETISPTAPIERPGLVARGIDATLGVEGLPQSATGQTALFTGVNAAAALGRHVAAFPGPRLRGLLERHSLFRALAGSGRTATFANPFTPAYWRAIETRRRRASATALAALAGGQRFRDLADWRRGEAVPWDLVGDRMLPALERAGEDPGALADWPRRSPEEAGRHLVGLAARHDFTLHETFLPDLAGHRRWGVEPEWALPRLDAFLGGVLAARAAAPEVTVVLTSDHGNSEAMEHGRHTRNPVPLLAVGPGAGEFVAVDSLLGVAPAILRVLGVPMPSAPAA